MHARPRLRFIAKDIDVAGSRKLEKPEKRVWNKVSREKFLGHLAETSNVTASAKAAAMTASSVYALRRRSPEFRNLWAEALAEGYARLEAELLRQALTAVDGKADADTVRQQVQTNRLGLTLLAQHRASVKGGASIGEASRPLKDRKEALLAKIDLVRERLRLADQSESAPGAV